MRLGSPSFASSWPGLTCHPRALVGLKHGVGLGSSAPESQGLHEEALVRWEESSWRGRMVARQLQPVTAENFHKVVVESVVCSGRFAT